MPGPQNEAAAVSQRVLGMVRREPDVDCGLAKVCLAQGRQGPKK